MTQFVPAVVVVDGSSYLYRAYHALPPLMSSSGQATGAIKGVVSMLQRLQKDYPDSPLVVVFDAKGKTFRDEIYPEYKATRPPMPDDLRSQIEPLHQIVAAMGLTILIEPGVEADDVIGTLVQQAGEAALNVLVSTGDKDLAQLVNPHVRLVDTMKNTVMDEHAVEAKFGVPPSLIIDLLALVGDSSDNIPGVPGVGPKTAVGLLQHLGGLECIYARLEAVKTLDIRGAKSLGAKLQAHRESAFLSYTLATIKCDVPLAVNINRLPTNSIDAPALLALYMALEFKAWASDMKETIAVESEPVLPAVPICYETVLDEVRLAVWIKKIEAASVFAFDTETTSLQYMEANIVGVSLSCEAGSAAYIPCGHDYLGAPVQLSRDRVLSCLAPFLESRSKKVVGQNLKYDANVLANHNITLRGIAYDTMLESYVLNATAGRHDMDTLAGTHLGVDTIRFEAVAGKGAKQLTFNQVELDKAAPYAAEDADITLRLHEKLWPQLIKEGSLQHVFEAIERPLIPVLSRMERQGVLIDYESLVKQSNDHAITLEALETAVYEQAGETFNLSSPKQLGVILFEKLHLPVIKKTKTGQASTAEDVLQTLALDYPLPRLLLEYRSIAKLKSTYTDKLPRLVDPRMGRVHTSYHQAVTATGRLSSADPNLQNIPIKTAEGRRVRQAFVAPAGYQIIAADYSQIELRIMAHLSGDEGLTTAFEQGLDVHSATASEVFDTPLDMVTAAERRSAKAINFGLIYGMSAFGLAKQLGINRKDAQQYIDTYFARYPGVADYMTRTRESAAEQGFVETLQGRRLYLPNINASNGMRRQAAERVAINAPMQGTAADIIKKAMIDVDAWLCESASDARMIMQVHDELVLEVEASIVLEVSQQVNRLMAEAVTLSVPLVVEVGTGPNWDEAH